MECGFVVCAVLAAILLLLLITCMGIVWYTKTTEPSVKLTQLTQRVQKYRDYAAKNAELSRKTGGGGYYQFKQRDPKKRLELLQAVDFKGKTVLDIGCNSGEMLHLISNDIKWGVGVDFDPIRINEANLKRAHNLSFYNFNLSTENLDVLKLFAPGPIDIVFLFAVCNKWMPSKKCSNILLFIKENSKTLCIEINGDDAHANKTIEELRGLYSTVSEVTDIDYCPDCLPCPKCDARRLLYCY